jgi:hypothetical protein
MGQPEWNSVVFGSPHPGTNFPIRFRGKAFKGCTIHFSAKIAGPGQMNGGLSFEGSCKKPQYPPANFFADFQGATCP